MIWEYKTIRLTLPVANYREKRAEDLLGTLEPLLNEAGKDEWELVGTFDTGVLGYTKFIVAIFKRPRK